MGLPGWDSIKKKVKGLIETALDGFSSKITGKLKGVLDPITSAFSTVKDYLASSLDVAKTYVDDKLKSITSGFKDLVGWVSDKANNSFSFVKDKFEDLSKWVVDGLKTQWNGIVKGFENFGKSILDGIKGLLSMIKGALLDFADYLVEKFEKIMEFSDDKIDSLIDFTTKYSKKMESKLKDDLIKKFTDTVGG